MADPTLQEVMTALRKADAAGNVEDAKRLAALADRLSSGQSTPAAPEDGIANDSAIGQVNRGIANTIDFFNPFDDPAWQNVAGGRFYTGSAADRFRDVGVATAEGEPEGIVEGALRGSGEAATAIFPVAKGLQALSKSTAVGPAVRQFADDAVRSLSSVFGVGLEAGAGAISGGAEEAAEEAGAPEWVQTTAAIGAPVAAAGAIPAAVGAGRIAASGAERYLPIAGPVVTAAKRLPGQVSKAVAPYTERGAREIARERVQGLVGGQERGEALAGQLSEPNPLGLTPAQRLQDPNLLGLERLASEQDPLLRINLEGRAGRARATAEAGVREGAGDVEDARQFIAQRRREFTRDLQARVDDALGRTQQGVENIRPTREAGENSQEVMREISTALDSAKATEQQYWDQVPLPRQVPTTRAKATAREWADKLGRVGEKHIPGDVKRFLLSEDGFGDRATVKDMHDLYSELRQVARNAMAGADKRPKMANVANKVAEAILADLDAIDPNSDIGRTVHEAIAYSRSLHATFDQGEVGRLLRRNISTDTTIAPELALERTVGRGGTSGAVGSDDINAATLGRAEPFIRDYIKGRFQSAAVNPDGEFTRASARRFIRDNRELLARHPELRQDIENAVSERVSADDFAQRVTDRLGALSDKRRSVGAAFLDGAPDKAINAVLNADSPAQAARRLANEARKDDTGAALDGLKGAFSDFLISKAGSGMDGEKLFDAIRTPRLRAAMAQVFTSQEMQRFNVIARELSKLDRATTNAANVGTELSGARPNKMVEYLARVVAARQGADLGGGGGGSLQTAQMASSRVKEALGYLVQDKAATILSDAITDEDLFKSLLLNLQSPAVERRTLPKLIPYLVGTGTAATVE